MSRIAFVAPSLAIGGAEQWMLDLVAGLDGSDIEVASCVLTHERYHPEMLAKMSALVPVQAGDNAFFCNRRTERSLLAVLEDIKCTCDAVIVWEICSICLPIVDRLGLPVINVFHREAASTEAYTSPDHTIVAVAPHLRALLARQLGRACYCVPNGVSLKRCSHRTPRQQMRRNWGCSDDTLIFGYIGRIDPDKNCLGLIDLCRAAGPTAALVIYGRSQRPRREEERLLGIIHRELGARVQVHDATTDIGSVLAAIDVFALPSRTEVMSLGLLEAWAAGVPTVATRVGAVPSLEQQYGQLVVPIEIDASESELRKAIAAACSDKYRNIIVPRARRMVADNFTAERCVEQWSELIRDVISRYQ